MKRKLITSILIVSIIMSLVSCTNNSSSQTGGQLKAGEYTGTANGFGGEIKAVVTVAEGKITDVVLTGDKETKEIGGAALDQLQKAIIEKNSADIEVVSGATITSNAVIDAINLALNNAKGIETEESTVKDGKYLTKAMGHEDYIYVTTMFKDGAIVSCEVTSHEETMGIGNYATARMPKKIVESQSLNADAVSGATVSSNAVKAAVTQAIKDAGGSVATFQKEVEQAPLSTEVVEEKYDVIVVGAGTAGLITANRLAEEGKNVIVFEKMDIPGGSMATTYSGIMNSYSELGKNYGLGREQESASWNKELLMPVFENYINEEYDRFDKAQPYQNVMMDASGKVVDWLHDMGVGFASMGNFEGGLQYGFTPYLAPGCYQGGAGYALMFLAQRLEQRETKVVYSTPVTELTTNENGDVTGVIAKGKDGKTWNITADAVVMATGGFASNQEMIEEYYPQYAKYKFNSVAASTGEGIKMAEEAGAAIECMGRPLGAFMSEYGSNYELAFMHSSTPGIIVNVNGDQFGNIMKSNHKTLAEALVDPKNGETFYYVFDDSAAESTKDFDAYGLSYKSIFERDQIKRYDSVADAAKELNLPNLEETIKKNNELALAGEADEFGRKGLPYIETRDGIWMLRIIPTFYLTTGGVAIDLDARVLNEEGKAIKGLYAAGDVTGSIEEKDGKEYGNGFDAALTYGYVVADTIIEDLK